MIFIRNLSFKKIVLTNFISLSFVLGEDQIFSLSIVVIFFCRHAFPVDFRASFGIVFSDAMVYIVAFKLCQKLI